MPPTSSARPIPWCQRDRRPAGYRGPVSEDLKAQLTHRVRWLIGPIHDLKGVTALSRWKDRPGRFNKVSINRLSASWETRRFRQTDCRRRVRFPHPRYRRGVGWLPPPFHHRAPQAREAKEAGYLGCLRYKPLEGNWMADIYPSKTK
jgi:hypothetical protein